MKLKRLALFAGIVVSFLSGSGVTVFAYSGTVQGRTQYHGYFNNASDSGGWEVLNISCSGSGEYGGYNYNNGINWCNAIPYNAADSASNFINFIFGRLNNGVPNCSYGFSCGSYGDPRAKTGA